MSDSKKQVYFCHDCWIAWDLEDGPKCPKCGKEVKSVPWFWKNLVKTRGKQTGPKTLEGRRIAERNLRENNYGPGHKNPEAVKHTRLNAVKHGQYLVASPIYPAKPGKYPDCISCPVREQCESEEWKYCPQKTDKIYEFQGRVLAAIKNNNLEELDTYAGLTMAKAYSIMQDMLENVFKFGTTYKETTEFENGTVKEKIVANPMLEIIPKYMDRLGMTAQDRKLTQKQQGETTPDAIMDMIRELFSGQGKHESPDMNDFKFDDEEEDKDE